MQLPGMLVEYLINGSCALIWIWGIFELLNINFPSVSDPRLLLLVPGLYVVGMIVDHLAWLLDSFEVNPRVKKAGLKVWDRFPVRWRRGKTASFLRFDSTKIILYSPDLGKEYVMRSSRDRIARGAFINTVLITVVFVVFSLLHRGYLGAILLIGITFSVLCFSMWCRFEASTSKYQRRAIEAIEEKQKMTSPDFKPRV